MQIIEDRSIIYFMKRSTKNHRATAFNNPFVIGAAITTAAAAFAFTHPEKGETEPTKKPAEVTTPTTKKRVAQFAGLQVLQIPVTAQEKIVCQTLMALEGKPSETARCKRPESIIPTDTSADSPVDFHPLAEAEITDMLGNESRLSALCAESVDGSPFYYDTKQTKTAKFAIFYVLQKDGEPLVQTEALPLKQTCYTNIGHPEHPFSVIYGLFGQIDSLVGMATVA